MNEPVNADSTVDPETEPRTDSPNDPSVAGTLDSPVAERVYELLAPVVATAEVELLDVEWTGGTLRVVLDNPDGVTTDSLTTVNRLISPILDQHDPVPGRYTLEVSSPGVERPLRRAEHYRRAVGENIIAKTIPGVDPRRVKGRLQAIDGSTLTVEAIEVDGVDLLEPETLSLDTAEIASARTVFDWGPTPKPGTGKPGQKAQPKKPHGKNQKQSQRKAKKAAGRNQAGAKKARSGEKQPGQNEKPQPNTAEQKRGRP
ncbi:MAG: ribosome maturation factor RimP [Acidimicrobiales bacterium]